MEVSDYTNLIISEHADKPKFVALASALLQGFVDANKIVSSFPDTMLDIDTAKGEQLDFLGKWIGLSRTLRTPLLDVFFSFDIAGLGFDEGVCDGPPNASTGLVSMDDDTYRQLLALQVVANNWDGSLSGAGSLLASVFASQPNTHIFIEDNMDMSIVVGVTGTIPSALFQALLINGYFNVRPAAVEIASVLVGTGPFFGFDIENFNISGFDVGFIT